MKLWRGCSGITRHACTQPSAISAPFSTNRSGIAAPKLSQADGEDAKQAMEKQESKPAFQLSHSHDYYGLYNLLRDTDSEGKAKHNDGDEKIREKIEHICLREFPFLKDVFQLPPL